MTAVELEVANRALTISSPDKIYFPDLGFTKLDVVEYYLEVEPAILTALKGRPVLMQRFPNGVNESSFFQKRVPKNAPEWLTTTTVSTPNGTKSDALVIDDLAHLIWAVNLGCIGFHIWPYKANEPDIADQLRIDLDPSDTQSFKHIVEAAFLAKELLDELNIDARCKTSGNKGIHIYAKLETNWDSYDVRRAAVAIARELERRHPKLITAEWWKEERGERVFVDYNQNAPHKTMFGTWCVRPVKEAKVSTPIYWEELESIVPSELRIDTTPSRLAELGDPWDSMKASSLTGAIEMYHSDIANGLMDAPWPPQYPKQPGEPPRVQPSRAKKPK